MTVIGRSTVLAAALAFAGYGGATAQGAAAPAVRVEIARFAFAPAQVTVNAGATVSWVNHDEEAHTVTSLDRSYGSAGLEHDEVYSHRFAAPGTYTYFCALHPHMTATVVVR